MSFRWDHNGWLLIYWSFSDFDVQFSFTRLGFCGTVERMLSNSYMNIECVDVFEWNRNCFLKLHRKFSDKNRIAIADNGINSITQQSIWWFIIESWFEIHELWCMCFSSKCTLIQSSNSIFDWEIIGVYKLEKSWNKIKGIMLQ